MIKLPIAKEDLLIGILVSGIFILLSYTAITVFESLEKIVYGIEMRLDLPRQSGENKIAIVNIDDKSLKQLGPWPWPRHIIADMITILKNNGARFIGLDLLFSEKEQNQGLIEIRKLQAALEARNQSAEKDTWVLDALKDMEERLDNDRVLTEAVKACGNIILPVVGNFGEYETELVVPEGSFIKRNTLKNAETAEGFIHVNQLTTPFSELSEKSYGLGHINPSPNKLMKGWTHLLSFNYRGHLIPSMPFRLASAYLNQQPEGVIINHRGIQFEKYFIPTLKGEILIKFKGARRSFPYYSFVDILNVKNVPAVFENKIVLVGYTAENANAVNTPVDPKLPRVELTANIIEGLMKGRYLLRPVSMIYIEALILILLSLFASNIFPRLNLVNRIVVITGMLFLVFLTGVICFVALNIWFKTIYISLSIITIFIVTSVRILKEKSQGLAAKESIETNRMLGLSFQSQGLLDLAFEKFRKCPLDDAMKDVIYNLGLDYERKRMTNKAIAVYEYMTQKDSKFRELEDRIPKLKRLIGALPPGGGEGRKEQKIVVADDLEIKPTVGRYEILKELGQGAMGIVYQARDPKIHRLLAIKTIRFADEFEDDRVMEVKARFFREAEIAGKLSHPAIVSIYDAGEDYELTYLAMEFLEGEDLQKYCRKGSLFPLRKVLQIVGETASALDYAHQQGVIHRDIKPGNIMILKDGKIKVTDFGIAKAVSSSQTKSGVILGTPNYMSPEQINGENIDGRSDIFSLGVVFYELLTGQLPFQAKTITNLFYQITQVKHPSPRKINPRIPKPCEQILDKALVKDPDKRFARAGDIERYVKALIQKIDERRGEAD